MEQVSNHTWPSGGSAPLATLAVHLAVISEKYDLLPEHWHEDGLGPASGAFCRLSSGRVILLLELAYLLEKKPAPILDILVDLGDLANVGGAVLLSEVVADLAIPIDAVTWSAGIEAEQSAAKILQVWRSRS